MTGKEIRNSGLRADVVPIPFFSVEEAWFWFVQAQRARAEGARLAAAQGALYRPCEPMDVLQILDRLYRQRRLTMDHLLVLRHYGLRMMPPDPQRPREFRAWKLWTEALERVGAVMIARGIVVSGAPMQDRSQPVLEAAE